MYVLAFHLLAFKLANLAKIKMYGFSRHHLAMFTVIENNNTYMWIMYLLVGVVVPLAEFNFFDQI